VFLVLLNVSNALKNNYKKILIIRRSFGFNDLLAKLLLLLLIRRVFTYWYSDVISRVDIATGSVENYHQQL